MNRRQLLWSAAPALALAATPALAAQAAGAPAASWAEVDRLAQAMIADRRTPGLSVAVVRDGRTLYAKGFGLANLETGTPVTPETVFRVGSLIKQFTGALLLLLQREGLLSVDDRLSRWLPDFPRANDLTLRRMLTHTSGLGNYTDARPERLTREMRVAYAQAELVEIMKRTDPLFVFEPGEGWAYSNTAYALLGVVAEKATNQPFATLLKTRVLSPLGLSRSAFDDEAEVVPGRASGYSTAPTAPGGWANAPYLSMTYPGAAGSLRSTPSDLCAWHQAVLAGRLLNPAELMEWSTPGRTNAGELPTQPGPAGAPARPVEYGFGIGAATIEGRRALVHTGGINGFVADLRTFTEEKLSLAVCANCDGDTLGTATRDLRVAIVRAARA